MEAWVAREPQNLLAVETLLRAFRASGDIPKLAQLIETRTGVSTDAFEKKALLGELATLRETQGEAELAFLALFRAFKEDPNDAELRHRLENATDASNTYDELVSAYEESLPRVAEAADAADVCLKLGQMLETRLREPERAITYYERARSLHASVQQKALIALDRLYVDLEAWQELAGVLEALASGATEPADKVGYLFRLGQLCQDRLDSPDRAAGAFEQILALDPAHLASARLLEGLYEAAGAADKLYAILQHEADRVTGPERERVLSKMAQVSAEGLDDFGRSIELYRELLAKNPRNDQAFTALEGLLESAEPAGGTAHAAGRPAGGDAGSARAGAPQRAAGPGGVPAARSSPRRRCRTSRPRWIATRATAACWTRCASCTRRRASARSWWRVLRRLVPLQESSEGVKALRVRLAEVLADMGRREEALDAARRALEVEPHTVPDLDRVQTLFVTLRAYNDAVRALELKVQVHLAAEEREQAVATYFSVADLWEGPGAKPEQSAGALEKVLELDPANRTAFERVLHAVPQPQRLACLRRRGGPLHAAPRHGRGEAHLAARAGAGAGGAAGAEGRGLPGHVPRAADRRCRRHHPRGGGAAGGRDGLPRGAGRRLRGGGGRAAEGPAGRAHLRHAGAGARRAAGRRCRRRRPRSGRSSSSTRPTPRRWTAWPRCSSGAAATGSTSSRWSRSSRRPPRSRSARASSRRSPASTTSASTIRRRRPRRCCGRWSSSRTSRRWTCSSRCTAARTRMRRWPPRCCASGTWWARPRRRLASRWRWRASTSGTSATTRPRWWPTGRRWSSTRPTASRWSPWSGCTPSSTSRRSCWRSTSGCWS